MNQGTRPLTVQERALLRWMLEHSGPEAAAFMPQVELAEATLWKCECGCASFNLRIRGHPEAPPGCHPVADFVFGDRETLSGVFVFEKGGILSGLEVYGLAGDAPKSLPSPAELRPFVDESTPT